MFFFRFFSLTGYYKILSIDPCATVGSCGDRVSKGAVYGWALVQCDWDPHKKKRLRLRRTEGRPREDTGRRWPSASQRGKPQKKPTLPTP